jgi:hypothetical protein
VGHSGDLKSAAAVMRAAPQWYLAAHANLGGAAPLADDLTDALEGAGCTVSRVAAGGDAAAVAVAGTALTRQQFLVRAQRQWDVAVGHRATLRWRRAVDAQG